jgi:hypothetical protein
MDEFTIDIINILLYIWSALASATSWKVAGSIPNEIIGFFNWPSSRTMALGSTQPLTEMSTINLPGDKGRRKADSPTAICEPIV